MYRFVDVIGMFPVVIENLQMHTRFERQQSKAMGWDFYWYPFHGTLLMSRRQNATRSKRSAEWKSQSNELTERDCNVFSHWQRRTGTKTVRLGFKPFFVQAKAFPTFYPRHFCYRKCFISHFILCNFINSLAGIQFNLPDSTGDVRNQLFGVRVGRIGAAYTFKKQFTCRRDIECDLISELRSVGCVSIKISKLKIFNQTRRSINSGRI